MNCPKCGKEMNVSIDQTTPEYQDISFLCFENEIHSYFVRIKREDLLEG